MKNRLIIALTAILMALSFSVSAQTKDKKDADKATVVYDVSMTCESCKKRIEKNIAFEKGVTDMRVDLPAKTVTIDYSKSKTDEQKLKQALEKLGYTVSLHKE